MLKNGTNMAELFAVLKTFSTKTSSILSGGLSHVNVTFSFRKKCLPDGKSGPWVLPEIRQYTG